jgi:UDP-N-acetyl-D-galactosamine dehydrogenase
MKAQQLGYQPEVILAGRRINDGMGKFVAQRLVKLLVNADIAVKGARIGVLGLSFKEDVNDIRNSKVPDIIHELREYGINAMIHDPLANPKDAHHEYGLDLASLDDFRALDGIVFAVSHKAYLDMGIEKIAASVRNGGVFVDVKSAFHANRPGRSIHYWSL